MIRLYLGVFMFAVLHFLPALAPRLRDALKDRLGENPYKGIFALLLLVAVVLMVSGWRSSPAEIVYVPPRWAVPVALVLMVLAVWLFTAPYQPTRIRRYVRHPQLAGVAVWSFSHLLANGDSRSLVLFGGLGLWALIEMPLINRREGPWQRPVGTALYVEVRTILISAVIFFALLYLHPYLGGIPLLGQ